MISFFASLTTDQIIDISAIIFGIVALTLIFIFYRSRTKNSTGGVFLIVAILAIVVGAIYYSPKYGYPPFEKIKIGDLEIVIQRMNQTIEQLDCAPEAYHLCEICMLLPENWPTCDAFSKIKNNWKIEHVSKLTPEGFFKYITLTRYAFIKEISKNAVFQNNSKELDELKVAITKLIILDNILIEEFKELYCPCKK